MEPLFEFLSPAEADHPYTVSEINDGIALILESGNNVIWVEGEISNWKVSSNGHCYFRLKDSESQIPAVLWRTNVAKLQFAPEEGLSILAIASLRVYKKAGYYQLDVHRMEPRGKGALFLAFEQLTLRLEKEGLFDPAHKVPLPLSIRRLGVVTSKHGAAIQDIVRVVASRAPDVDIVLIDVPVQGETAATKIAEALHVFNQWGGVECIIIGRGGGSVEDLRPFNEEVVAHAIYDSEIPVVSAVGHEINFTIADFAADVRAPTPSAAAEMTVPDRTESRRFFDGCASRFSGAAGHYFDRVREHYDACAGSRSLKLPLQLILELEQGLDNDAVMLNRYFSRVIVSAKERLAASTAMLNDLSPLAVLGRGYSVITKENGASVRESSDLSLDEPVSMRFFKGTAKGIVKEIGPE